MVGPLFPRRAGPHSDPTGPYGCRQTTTQERAIRTTGNTILITGGTSGIGRGLARRFHAAGNTVVVAGRRRDLLDQLRAEHAGMDAVVLDVTDPTSILACLHDVITRYPELNVLINNAGIMLPEDLADPAHL